MFLELIHPITKENVNVFTPEIMELFTQGYNINEILSLCNQVPLRYNRSNIMTNDLIFNYMMYLETKDIDALCLIDKHATTFINSGCIWKVKITNCMKDFGIKCNMNVLLNLNNITYTKKLYQKVYRAIMLSNCYGRGNSSYDFGNEDLTVINQCNTLTKYDPTKYCNGQQLHLSNHKIILNCLSIGNNLDTFIIKHNHKKEILFSIFYNFPNVFVGR